MHSGIPTKVLTAGVAGTLLASLTACGSGSASGSGVHIVTSVYPLEWLASQVGGDAVTVTNLTEAGADPHEVELSPRQIGTVADADLVLHIRGLQPAVDDAVDQHAADRFLDPADVVDLLPVSSADHEHDGHAEEQHSGADSHSHGGKDPHLWLDPERLAEVSAALADRLSDIDPDHAAAYQENHETVAGELSDLSAAYTESLDTCALREIVVTHAAFGYLAEMHDLEQISVTGIDSHHEDPSPARIAAVVREIDEHGVTTVFTSPLADPAIAETIASETGAEIALLDPLESLTDDSPGTDYLSVMRANLDALVSALGCS